MSAFVVLDLVSSVPREMTGKNVYDVTYFYIMQYINHLNSVSRTGHCKCSTCFFAAN